MEICWRCAPRSAVGMLMAPSLLHCDISYVRSRQHVGLLPDMWILLKTMFRFCSSLFLALEQETAVVVPSLPLGRSHSQTHAPLVLQKKMEDLPSFSSKEQKTLLGCSRVQVSAVSAKNSGIWGLMAKIKP